VSEVAEVELLGMVMQAGTEDLLQYPVLSLPLVGVVALAGEALTCLAKTAVVAVEETEMVLEVMVYQDRVTTVLTVV
jgi:hypothetical protein